MSVDFDFSQVEALAADIEDAPVSVVRLTPVAVRAIANDFAAAARTAAPVDEGELVASIHVISNDDASTIVADSDHAFFVEFGTNDTPPQPYMWPQIPQALTAMYAALEELGDPLS
jgi:HK97 gp10 family phage protein